MANLRTINVDLNRQYRNDLNFNFQQIEAMTGISTSEIARVERESKERDNLLAGTDVDAIIRRIDTSADNADAKAQYANAQGDYAKQQGDYAKAQGDYAELKGDYADEKAILADSAAANANNEASNLSQLKVDVVDATQSANTAADSLKPLGAYDAVVAYVPRNIAEFNGSGYMNILESTGIEPTDETYWKKVVSKGEQGERGLPGVGSGTVSSVNGIEPDSVGNVELVIPDPDLSELATKQALSAHENEIASVTTLGHVKLNNTPTSTSTTEAATANVVKQVNDKLVSRTVAIGQGASASGTDAVSVGMDSKSGGGLSVSVGRQANSSGVASIAIGWLATASQDDAVAIGNQAQSLNAKHITLGSSGYSVKVPGSLSVAGTKQFEMFHPHPDKKDTHVLRHSAVESPTAGDTLYRYPISSLTDDATISILLPDYFQYLNKDVDVWINGVGHFGRAYGHVENGWLYVTCELAGDYNALVIGTRNDDHDSVQNWHIKGVEREIGESWTEETYVFEDDEILTENEYLEATV